MSRISTMIRVVYNKLRFSFLKGITCSGGCTSRIGNDFSISNGGRMDIGYHMCALKNCRFSAYGGTLKIGDNVGFNTNCIISSHENIDIGSNVEVGPNVCIYDHDHDLKCEGGIKAGKFITSPVVIGDNVWIGANVVILRGSSIGKNCIIAAGSVVNGNVPDCSAYIQKRETTIKAIKPGGSGDGTTQNTTSCT